MPRRISRGTTAWLVLATVLVAGAFVAQRTSWLRAGDQVGTWLLRQLAALRTPWLTDLANWINDVVMSWHPVIAVAVVLLTIVFRRWRHLLVLAASLFALEIALAVIYDALSRPRPYGVPVIGRWDGYSAPSPTVAAITFLLTAAVFCLAVPGRPRAWATAGAAVVVAAFCLSRLYLAVDHPDDVLLGLVLGAAIPVTAFRFFTPNAQFPVVYRRGRTAHVDVTGPRGAAIRQAVHDQVGLTVLDIAPVGLESSAGSTPLRLTVQGDPGESLFGKLYTRGHVRADRWYKLWRTILYGTLEDEHPFHSVRQLAQYEDYVLRLLQDAGVRSAAPYGIVEITPERGTGDTDGHGRGGDHARGHEDPPCLPALQPDRPSRRGQRPEAAEQVAGIAFEERAQLGRAGHAAGGGEGFGQLVGGEVSQRAAVDPLRVGAHRQHQHHVA